MTRRLSGGIPVRSVESVMLALLAVATASSADIATSVNSIDEMLSADSPEVLTDAWMTDLADRVEEIINRKRSSVQGRETCLASYIRILTAHYAEEEVRGKEAELVTAFLKSIKTESSEKETVLAMKGRPGTIHAGFYTCS